MLLNDINPLNESKDYSQELNIKNFPHIAAYSRAQKHDRFPMWLADIQTAFEQGYLIKSKYKDLSSSIMTLCDDAFHRLHYNYLDRVFSAPEFKDYATRVQWLKDNTGVNLYDLPMIQINTVAKLHRIMKQVKDSGGLLTNMKHASDEIVALANILKELKTLQVSKNDLRAKENKKKEAEQHQVASHSDVVRVKKEMDNLTKEIRPGLVKSIQHDFDNAMKEVNAYLATKPNANSIKQEPKFKNPIAAFMFYRITNNEYNEELGYRVYVLKSDYKKWIDNEVKRNADDVIAQYTNKNIQKLALILNKKNNLDEIHHRANVGQVIEGEMTFTFADGAQFTVVNKVVWSISVLGKDFARFPTTFHNVKLSDGSKMNNPSEKKMIKEFK